MRAREGQTHNLRRLPRPNGRCGKRWPIWRPWCGRPGWGGLSGFGGGASERVRSGTNAAGLARSGGRDRGLAKRWMPALTNSNQAPCFSFRCSLVPTVELSGTAQPRSLIIDQLRPAAVRMLCRSSTARGTLALLLERGALQPIAPPLDHFRSSQPFLIRRSKGRHLLSHLLSSSLRFVLALMP